MTGQGSTRIEALLASIVAKNSELGHENLGFVSLERGVMPLMDPLVELAGSHRAWDELGGQLPELISKQRVHAAVGELPLLSGTSASLDECYLRRASLLLANICHAHYWSVVGQPKMPPAHLFEAWQTVCRRLGRPDAGLTSMDVLYNWRFVDAGVWDPFRLENLELLAPISGNQEEDVEYRASLEMMGQATPLVAAIADAACAVSEDDIERLCAALYAVTERVLHLAEVPFQKISLSPHSETHVDPSIWGKAAGYFSGPIHEGEYGLSGGAYPIFPILDAFVGRASYASSKGKESMEGRRWFPANLRSFIDETAKIGVRDFVLARDEPRLTGLFQQLLDAYSGGRGFLGAHRLKAYAFMEVGFKAGRAMTNGGFRSENLFREKTWEQIDDELNEARLERSAKFPTHCFLAGSIASKKAKGPLAEVRFDTTGTGIHFEAGDRVGVLPENEDSLVERTLKALAASGDVAIPLDAIWQQAVALRAKYWRQKPTHIPLMDFLRYARIRPASRSLAKRLLALTANTRLRRIVNTVAADQWEFWDLLNLVRSGGFDPRVFWRAEGWDLAALCRLLEPEDFRLYSIASTQRDSDTELRVLASRLSYRTCESDTSAAETRVGSASSYLHRVASEPGTQVSLRIVRALRFHLPDDRTRPVVMFAAGSGFAPFAGFIEERAKDRDAESWLFYGVRNSADFYGREFLDTHAQTDSLNVHVAFSQEDRVGRSGRRGTEHGLHLEPRVRCRIDTLMQEEGVAAELWELLKPRAEGGKGAVFYVCGKTGFAVTVENALRNVVRRFQGESDEKVWSFWNKLAANGRYLHDIFSTYQAIDRDGRRLIDATELVAHNTSELGQWMAISGRVYDVSTFLYSHPGGDKIIELSCGIDGTRPYQKIDHHRHAEIDSLLGMYEIGRVRRLDFRRVGGLSFTPDGVSYVTLESVFKAWVRYLYLVVEMQNALAVDLDFLNRSLTAYEESEQLTPFKVQIFIESQRRFWDQCIANLTGEDLDVLWRVTCGLCSSRADARWMKREIEKLNASPEAQAGRRTDDLLRAQLERWKSSVGEGAIARDNVVHSSCAELCERSRAFLLEFKQHIRAGVAEFERNESHTLELAAGELLAVLRAVPDLVRHHHAVLSGFVANNDKHLLAEES